MTSASLLRVATGVGTARVRARNLARPFGHWQGFRCLALWLWLAGACFSAIGFGSPQLVAATSVPSSSACELIDANVALTPIYTSNNDRISVYNSTSWNSTSANVTLYRSVEFSNGVLHFTPISWTTGASVSVIFNGVVYTSLATAFQELDFFLANGTNILLAQLTCADLTVVYNYTFVDRLSASSSNNVVTYPSSAYTCITGIVQLESIVLSFKTTGSTQNELVWTSPLFAPGQKLYTAFLGQNHASGVLDFTAGAVSSGSWLRVSTNYGPWVYSNGSDSFNYLFAIQAPVTTLRVTVIGSPVCGTVLQDYVFVIFVEDYQCLPCRACIGAGVAVTLPSVNLQVDSQVIQLSTSFSSSVHSYAAILPQTNQGQLAINLAQIPAGASIDVKVNSAVVTQITTAQIVTTQISVSASSSIDIVLRQDSCAGTAVVIYTFVLLPSSSVVINPPSNPSPVCQPIDLSTFISISLSDSVQVKLQQVPSSTSAYVAYVDASVSASTAISISSKDLAGFANVAVQTNSSSSVIASFSSFTDLIAVELDSSLSFIFTGTGCSSSQSITVNTVVVTIVVITTCDTSQLPSLQTVQLDALVNSTDISLAFNPPFNPTTYKYTVTLDYTKYFSDSDVELQLTIGSISPTGTLAFVIFGYGAQFSATPGHSVSGQLRAEDQNEIQILLVGCSQQSTLYTFIIVPSAFNFSSSTGVFLNESSSTGTFLNESSSTGTFLNESSSTGLENVTETESSSSTASESLESSSAVSSSGEALPGELSSTAGGQQEQSTGSTPTIPEESTASTPTTPEVSTAAAGGSVDGGGGVVIEGSTGDASDGGAVEDSTGSDGLYDGVNLGDLFPDGLPSFAAQHRATVASSSAAAVSPSLYLLFTVCLAALLAKV